MYSLDTAHVDCQTVCCAHCHLKKNLTRFQKEGNMFLNHTVTGDESRRNYDIPTSKQSSLTLKNKIRTRCKPGQNTNWKSNVDTFLTFLGLYWSNGYPKT